MNDSDTDVIEFISNMDAGTLHEKLARVISAVSANVIDQDKQGSITLTMKLDRIGTSYMVGCKTKLAYSHPTLRGSKTEVDESSTPFHVNRGGRLTFAPDTQGDIFDATTGGTDL